MGTDYKKTIREKRLEAGNLMTEDQIFSCNKAIHTASIAAGAAGAIPIPIADAIPMSAAQVLMVISLGIIFDQEISDSMAKGIISAAASTFAGRQLVKFVFPIVGSIASAGVAAGVTEAIGWMVAVDFAKSYRQEYRRKINAEEAAAAYADAEFYKAAADISDETVEDFSE